GVTRRRCWAYDWVVDMDINAFFDTLDHDLVERRGSPHRRSLAPAVHLAVAACPRSDAGRYPGTADPRNAAGRRHQSAPGQPLPALRIRRLDAAHVPAVSVCALRG